MLIRKLISALGATMMMVILFSILEAFAAGLFLGMYILPIVIIYGIPSSFLSDFLLRRTVGLKRMAIAGVLHVFLGVLFIAIPTFIFDAEYGSWLTALRNNGFLVVSAAVTAFIFWCVDEGLKSKWFADLKEKCLACFHIIGNMRI
ncbi:hypothetical protein [Mesobacillus thioparans]|uniref:hypothetical protein n=1 Tax=Mesobacillus thioparans TaxID=370439 RepID=UPI0039EE2655